ncbi:MAG: hypothetical protein K0R50_3254, partial [Eubacterium sp.]|nr:hypothetical protein [Eubacterium sp.]
MTDISTYLKLTILEIMFLYSIVALLLEDNYTIIYMRPLQRIIIGAAVVLTLTKLLL